MTFEELLAEMGEQPLKSSAYSRYVQGVLNANLTRENQITMEHTGQEILNRLYDIRDVERRDMLLAKCIEKPVRQRDAYRLVLIVACLLVSVIVILGAVLALTQPVGGSDNPAVALLTQVVDGVFGLVRDLLRLPTNA